VLKRGRPWLSHYGSLGHRGRHGVRSRLKAYRKSPAITEPKEVAGRGHSLTIDSGWRQLAEYSLAWLQAKGL
jgi:hypothetical protein